MVRTTNNFASRLARAAGHIVVHRNILVAVDDGFPAQRCISGAALGTIFPGLVVTSCDGRFISPHRAGSADAHAVGSGSRLGNASSGTAARPSFGQVRVLRSCALFFTVSLRTADRARARRTSLARG